MVQQVKDTHTFTKEFEVLIKGLHADEVLALNQQLLQQFNNGMELKEKLLLQHLLLFQSEILDWPRSEILSDGP